MSKHPSLSQEPRHADYHEPHHPDIGYLPRKPLEPEKTPLELVHKKISHLSASAEVANLVIAVLAAHTPDSRVYHDGLLREYLKESGPIEFTSPDGMRYTFSYLGTDPGWQAVPIGPAEAR
jgi:hypothetical protein